MPIVVNYLKENKIKISLCEFSKKVNMSNLTIQKLLKDKSHLKNILKKGSEKANIIAEENLKNIREKVGLI